MPVQSSSLIYNPIASAGILPQARQGPTAPGSSLDAGEQILLDSSSLRPCVASVGGLLLARF